MALPSLFRTTDDFLLDQISSVQAAGSQITDFHAGSAARTLMEANAAACSHVSLLLDQFQTDAFVQTATGDALDTKAADYDVERNAAVAATGIVRITRPATGAALVIPAGWGSLQTLPTPGVESVGFVTTEDASFGGSDLFIDVPAQAIDTGVVGNIVDGTVLLATNPVNGFASNGGFVAHGDFANGVDAESDDAFRKRIPITVRGRGKANRETFLAAALAVSGVTSAAVLRGGETRSAGGTVPAGSVEAYYAGSGGLLTAVQSALDGVAQINQDPTAFLAATVRCIASVTVFALSGVDTALLAANVTAALRALVDAAGVGGIVYMSEAIEAIHAIPEVVSVTIPFAQFRKNSDPGGTAGDIDPGVDRYAQLASADVTVAVTLL